MKTKRIKAATVMGWNIAHPKLDGPTMHYILPADAESYERMVEQMAAAIFRDLLPCTSTSWAAAQDGDKAWMRHASRAALKAIGITNPRATRRTKGTK
jgi:hypothetical protein